MFRLGNNDYKVCFLDTCIISDFFESPALFNKFISRIQNDRLILAISIYTINELKKSPNKYLLFRNVYAELPTFIIKPTQLLLKDEIKVYPDENKEDYLFYKLYKEMELLDYLDKDVNFQHSIEIMHNEKNDILESILKLKENFPPDNNGKYSDNKIVEFVKTVIFQQLTIINPKWVNSQLVMNKTIDFDKFKSLKSQILITFWKFYLMKERKVKKSDVFDISLSSSFPYVDIVITEKNIKNDILQIQNKGLFFKNLEVFTIND